jgi:sulfur carrier protein ThiS adenylyltransferase
VVPPAALAACHAVVVGVGAVGRQLAVQLAAMGVPSLTLVDHDVVAEENLAPQAYWPADLGRSKVDATADLCRRINPALRLTACPEPFRRSSTQRLACFTSPVAAEAAATPPGLALFACVDAIPTRELLWHAVRHRVAFFADARMSAEVVRVLACDRPAADTYYATTLFPAAQAFAGPCTARSTVYTASIAAGLMASAFTRWLRGLPVERDVLLNLLAAELTSA